MKNLKKIKGDASTRKFFRKRDKKITSIINLPLSDSLNSRLAFMTFTRDGMMYNTNLDSPFDDRNDTAMRLSMDWDISDSTMLKFTYSMNEADDNRSQQDVVYCAQDPFFGCSPYSVGLQGSTADSRGEVGGLLGLVAFGMPSTGIINSYAGAGSNATRGRVALDRNPLHASKNEFSNLELVTDITDELQFVAKYSYGTRKFKQIDDNDMSLATVPFMGRGMVDNAEENEIKTGNATFKDRHVSKAENQERSLNNHLTPLTKNLLDNVQNPANLVEEVSDERWVRGGVPSRQIVKDLDYYYRSKDEKKYKDYIMSKKAYMQNSLDCNKD